MKTKTITKSLPVQGANSPSKQLDDLRQVLKKMDDINGRLQKAESILRERENAHREYLEAVDNIRESNIADVVTNKSEDVLSIKWTEILGLSGFEECRRAEIVIPGSWISPKLFAMSDQQLGHISCDEARLIKDIQWTKSHPEVLAVLLGDGIDSATKTSPGSLRDNKEPPLRQIERFSTLHEPIADQIIGMVGGNHERRIDKALDEPGGALRLIAKNLNSFSKAKHKIPYSSGVLLLDIYWKGHLWTVTLFHGAGAAQSYGGQVQRMQKNLLLTDSLITLTGHLHNENKTSRRFVHRNMDGTLGVVKQTSLQCGTYLKYLGSYGEVAGMNPTGPDMVLIEFFPDGRYIDRFKGEGV